jgi:LPXTG-site transpeptidase (sortase) family protein
MKLLAKINFKSSNSKLYFLSIGALMVLLSPPHLFGMQPQNSYTPKPIVSSQHKIISKSSLNISGKPVRITIPDVNIDLPVDEGYYDKSSGTWTVSPNHAQFAVMTMPANNRAGTTFIYGHGTDAVFGKIGENPPPVGTIAQIYTDNNHIFSYQLQSVHNYNPKDTSLLDNVTNGPPQLLVQTCTGIYSQWRTMFLFTLEKAQ